MNRIIINNKAGHPDIVALQFIESVMREGKVSGNGEQYCFVTRFRDGTVVSADLLKSGHKFTVWKEGSAE